MFFFFFLFLLLFSASADDMLAYDCLLFSCLLSPHVLRADVDVAMFSSAFAFFMFQRLCCSAAFSLIFIC